MKKIIGLVIAVITTFFIVGCGAKKMKPYEDTEVKYLDGGWVSVWADEFNGDKLDQTKWSYETGGDGWGNNELQYYTYDNTEVSDGTLKIFGRKEQKNNNQYTSSRIVTSNKFNFKYGRVVASAKLPVGKGTWPAIWMMPQESTYGHWPKSGEIDIMEYVGYEGNKVHASIHTEVYNHKNNTHQTGSLKIDNLTDDFHKYELIWEPGFISISVDDTNIKTFRYNPILDQAYDSNQAFPFDQDFFLILNLAIGGDWGGLQGVDDKIFPAIFEVDYIRVYQKDYNYLDKSNPETPYNVQESRLKKNSIIWVAPYDDIGVEYYNVYVDGEFYKKANLPQITLKKLDKGKKYNIKIEAVDFTGKVSRMSEGFEHTFK